MEDKKSFWDKPLFHKVLGTDPTKPEEMQPKEVLSYSVAGFGQNMICQLVTSFLLFFLTDAVGINPLWLAIMFLCARLFDAFNDPIMGSIVDYTRSKYGKMRPYLLYMCIPICILTVLMFLSFDGISERGAFAYVTVIYLAWGICYTTVDVPYWGLATSMTKDTEKRNMMLTVTRLFCMAGAGIITVLIPIFQDMVRNSSTTAEELSHGYRILFLVTAIVVAVLALPTFFIGFKNTKERYYESDAKKSNFFHNIKLLFKNKPVLLLVAVGFFGCLRLIYMTSALYYAKYNLGNEAIFSVLTILVVPGGLLASLLTPVLSKKFGKRNVFIFSHILGGIAMLLLYFVGLSSDGTSAASKVLFYIVLIIMGIPSGFSNILQYSLIADGIDYLEWKTGERAEGICFSMQTLISKIGMAFTAFVVLLVLGIDGYADANKLTGDGVNKGGIWMMTTLLSGASTLLCVVPLFFYTFTEKKQKQAVKEVAAKKYAGLTPENWNSLTEEELKEAVANFEASGLDIEAGTEQVASSNDDDCCEDVIVEEVVESEEETVETEENEK